MESGKLIKNIIFTLKLLIGLSLVMILFVVFLFTWKLIPAIERNNEVTVEDKINDPEHKEEIIDGIDVSSGLIVNDGYLLVKKNCLACHSSKLIIQNRASREGWKQMIRWMQNTQNLWALGKNEDKILDYLARNYAITRGGRRVPLKDIEWYVLKDD